MSKPFGQRGTLAGPSKPIVQGVEHGFVEAAKRIGIIAGNGIFPLLTVRNARQEGYQIFVCAVQGEADPSIADGVDACQWIKLGQLKKLVTFFIYHGVRDCLMAGKITKTNLFKGEVFPDVEMVKLIARTKDRKDDTLLGAIADYLISKGIHLIDSTRFLTEHMAKLGVLSRQKPSPQQMDDVAFGWELAKEIGRLDVGQSVVVKNKSVLAIEAIEGTDEAIRRGGRLGGTGAVVVKVAKPKQDMRFDVPTVGPRTLEAMREVGAKVLAVEAGKTIVLDPDVFFKKLDEERVVFLGKL